MQWSQDPHSKCILWLRGGAGTGKSTIARTVANTFHENNQLGASFFFKRGEGDRGNALHFFPTIAAQLASIEPNLATHVKHAIDANPAISDKNIQTQFEKLVLEPLESVKRSSQRPLKLFVVVDALDECKPDNDIALIASLLSRTRNLKSVSLRTFVTSRPDVAVLGGFRGMSFETHQDVKLQDIPEATVEDDIFIFLKDEFMKVRERYNNAHSPDSWLPPNWPKEHVIRALAKMAVPLFIFATTVLRFAGELRSDPESRLAKVLQHQTASQTSEFGKVYVPILEQVAVSYDESEKGEFRKIVGSIIVLADPLSVVSLASILGVDRKAVGRSLDALHSVLNVPDDSSSPVRMFHLSFREFLLDCRNEELWFWVNEETTHTTLVTQCLKLLSEGKYRLKKDICNLGTLGKLRAEIDEHTILTHVPPEAQYACCYWISHLKASKRRVRDGDEVHMFLERYLLHWLEALSLLGRISESIGMIDELLSITDVSHLAMLELIYAYKDPIAKNSRQNHKISSRC
jgi:hypothetical protein